jgi:hypothetical protein
MAIDTSTETILVYEPTGTVDSDPSAEITPAPEDFHGLTIGILDNTKQHAREMMELVAEKINERAGGIRVVHRQKQNAAVPAVEADYVWLAKECDVVLTGSGD